MAVPDEIHDIFLLWFERFRGFFEVFQPIQYLFFPELNNTVSNISRLILSLVNHHYRWQK